jgi:hypothetical protein
MCDAPDHFPAPLEAHVPSVQRLFESTPPRRAHTTKESMAPRTAGGEMQRADQPPSPAHFRYPPSNFPPGRHKHGNIPAIMSSPDDVSMKQGKPTGMRKHVPVICTTTFSVARNIHPGHLEWWTVHQKHGPMSHTHDTQVAMSYDSYEVQRSYTIKNMLLTHIYLYKIYKKIYLNKCKEIECTGIQAVQ